MNGAERFFVDTNVLLYAVDPANPRKREAAQEWLERLWEHAAGRLSWQVLHEFYANAVRKPGRPGRTVRSTVEVFALWNPVDTTLGLIQRAWYWTEQAQLTYWDALIVSAAERSACAWLLSEDFQTGRRFGATTVLNPFRERPEAFGLHRGPR